MFDSQEDWEIPEGFVEWNYTCVLFTPELLNFILSTANLIDARYDCDVAPGPENYREYITLSFDDDVDKIMLLKLSL